MAHITTRGLALDGSTVSSTTANKGSALTHNEMDSNILNLNNGKLENTSDDFTGELSVKGSGGSATGAVRLYDNDDSNYVDLKAPATIGSNFTLTLPADDGNANEVLITDGSGNLSWSATSGDITGVTAGAGLTGGGAAGAVTLNVVGGTGITANADDIAIDTGTTVDKTTAQTLTNKSLTAPILTGSASSAGSILFKEDTDNGTNAVTLIGPAATGDVTVTLPAATDTLVGKATTDTLTNKTLTSPTIGTSILGGGTNADILLKTNQDGATGNNGPQGNWGWGGGVHHFNNPVSIGTTDTAAHDLMFNTGLQVTTTHDNWSTVAIKQFSDSGKFPNVWFVKSESDTGDAQSTDGETLGGFYASGYSGSNYYGVSGAVYFKADGDHTADSQAGYVEFSIMPPGEDDNSNRVEPLKIYSNRLDMDGYLRMGEVSKPSAAADHGFLYTKNDSGTAEVYVLDAADNETKISPHNAKGEWEYFSKNTKTGKTVRINMEEMIKDIEQLTGKTYIKDE